MAISDVADPAGDAQTHWAPVASVIFVVAAAAALGQVAPEEAGVASGVLSTSHELGSSLGAAVVSGVVAASLIAGTGSGFERGYLVAAAVAAGSAVLAGAVIPGRTR